ncbi:hypothetical protein BC936DRAFT_138634 [Jimgerdemannia flammicorona]|uniref:Cryptic loci regulator 2 N-terminal domain-containing protein n=1 Tax=Jimgerdemannia flammicorona TaxID=994334 RepID=A0A433BWZ8_9FUNG|nr:hypothetical protein BC936DRAFT_138634 [Jimgerdemannia flammicorona]
MLSNNPRHKQKQSTHPIMIEPPVNSDGTFIHPRRHDLVEHYDPDRMSRLGSMLAIYRREKNTRRTLRELPSGYSWYQRQRESGTSIGQYYLSIYGHPSRPISFVNFQKHIIWLDSESYPDRAYCLCSNCKSVPKRLIQYETEESDESESDTGPERHPAEHPDQLHAENPDDLHAEHPDDLHAEHPDDLHADSKRHHHHTASHVELESNYSYDPDRFEDDHTPSKKIKLNIINIPNGVQIVFSP